MVLDMVKLSVGLMLFRFSHQTEELVIGACCVPPHTHPHHLVKMVKPATPPACNAGDAIKELVSQPLRPSGREQVVSAVYRLISSTPRY